MNSKAYISLLFTTILVVFLGCKSAKTKAKSNFNTIVGKLKIEYTEKEKTDGITVSFRMEKDKVIWMSKLGIAKVLITPDKVAFYNKWDSLFEVFLLLNPSHFKMDSQQIWQPKEKRMLEIDYLAYQKVDNLTLPEKTKILAVEKDDQLEINLEFKSLVLNEKLRFPFKIPSGYDEIKLD